MHQSRTDLSLSRRGALAALAAGSIAAVSTPRGFAAPTAPLGAGAASGLVPAGNVFGVFVPGAPRRLAELHNITSALNLAPRQVAWFEHWAADEDFPAADVSRVAATGAIPEITWEPRDPSAGVTQPTYALRRIIAGAFDSYITRWARQIRAYREPVVIRFAHEMNGNWYPWSEYANGNAPGEYRAAWQRVRGIFESCRTSNAYWCWSPNVPWGEAHLADYYPGDGYVDRVALDGYNWSTTESWSSWQSFSEIFAPGLDELSSLTSLPVWIGEVGCAEVGGDKAGWIDDMFATLSGLPQVRGVTWFAFDMQTDWRIDSSPAALAAFARNIPSFDQEAPRAEPAEPGHGDADDRHPHAATPMSRGGDPEAKAREWRAPVRWPRFTSPNWLPHRRP
jgi:Glycosyl hydrolase family 26